jgi:feruloyl esterase
VEDRVKKLLTASLLVFTLAAASFTSSAQAVTATTSCAELRGTKIPAHTIGLPTAGAEVTGAQIVTTSRHGPTSIPAYCRVEAAIRPVDPYAPDIRMRVALPMHWNGKAMMLGGGGFNGIIPDITANLAYGPVNQFTPLERGYATFASDSGHQAAQPNLPSPLLDGSFGVNDEAVRNFAGDALKKTRDTALLLIKKFYGNKPAHSYFAGSSNGGREALAVAQRWPADFIGVIAVYPVWNSVPSYLFTGYEAQLLSKPGAFPGTPQQELLYRSVIRACDVNDGLRDDIISDEAGCHFDPRTLRCLRGQVDATTCLTDHQIAVIRALSSPLRWNYRLASGETAYPGIPFLSGADMTTPLLGLGTQPPANPMPTTAGAGVQFWNQWAKYFVTRDPAFNSLNLDPPRPGQWLQRISELSAILDVNNPDLNSFAKAGGKLLILHGTADETVSHRSSVEYFERIMKTMSKGGVKQFARLYLIPGANHGNIQAAFAASWDSLSALENWAEQGQAPRNPVVTDANAQSRGRTRPLCGYPAWPRYIGRGNPNSAASFICQPPARR